MALHLATKCFALNSGERDDALMTNDQIKHVHVGALLVLLKDMPEQGMFEMLS